MGVVYEAQDHLRDERVALKKIRHLRPEAMRRFKQEFRSLADIAHPNLISLYELVATGDDWFFTMELLEGVDIAAHFAPIANWSAPGAEEALRRALRQLAEGLGALHRGGHLHRDIKPSNVMVVGQRTVLLDFGVVAEVGEALSRQRSIVGTPKYTSPEQLLGEPLGFASDWYAVGVIIYRLLAGVAPFNGTMRQLLRAKLVDVAAPPSSLCEGVPRELEELCLALLDGDPAQRPDGAEVLSCLGAPVPTVSIRAPMRTPLVGREGQLGDLSDALVSVEAGQGVVALVRGASGMGKTALVDAFLGRASSRPEVLTLRGRCHERELVRFKAVDGVVDALGDHLAGLAPDVLREFLPRDSGLLSSAFPALGHLPTDNAEGASYVSDPRLLRERATAALRELLTNFARRRTLIVHIDDVQWGDQESAELIAALMDPPDTPPLMLILSYRVGDEERSPFLRALLTHERADGGYRRVDVDGLSEADGTELADAILRRRELVDSQVPVTIAAESGGSPLFIHAMARFAEESRTAIESGLSLDTVLTARADLLPADARAVLGLVAVAGMPSRHSTVRAALGLEPREYDDALQTLRAAQMIRSLGTGRDALVEVYHDRVRETQVAQMQPDERRDAHSRLARALAASEYADPESLFLHFRGAGDQERAAEYAALAAERAAAVLSFSRAATLYRAALEEGSHDREAAAALFERLATVLVAEGRGVEAAEAFLAAAAGRSGEARLDLERRAGEQELRAGLLVKGRQTFESVMSELGLKMPTNTLAGIASLLYWRLRLRLRGTHFEPQPVAKRDPRAAMRVDAMHGVAIGLSVSEPAIAGSLGARTVMEAFALGDPERAARALLLELVFVSTEGTKSAEKVERLLNVVRPIARSTESPNVEAFVQAIEGVVAFQQGRFVEAYERCEEAREVMLTQCSGMGWEVGSMSLYSVSSLTFMGTFSRLAEAPARAAEALSRGDIFTSASIRAGAVPALLMVRGDLAASRAEADEALRLWGQHETFQNVHFMATISHVQADLYEEHGERALRRIERNERGARRSFLLSVQVIRAYWTFIRANARLATAAGGRRDRKALIRAAAQDGASLLREGALWCGGLGNLVLAQVALLRGERRSAEARAKLSEEMLNDAHFRIYALAAGFVHGWAMGETRGEARRARVTEEAREVGVSDPRRAFLVFSPGLPRSVCA